MHVRELDSTGLLEGTSVFLRVLEIDKNRGYLAFLPFSIISWGLARSVWCLSSSARERGAKLKIAVCFFFASFSFLFPNTSWIG